MDTSTFFALWGGVFAIVLVLGVWMAAVIARHPHDVIYDPYADSTPDSYEVALVSFKPALVPENYIPEDDIDTYLDEQMAAHGGQVETTDFGYRHIWADGTRKVYWQEA